MRFKKTIERIQATLPNCVIYISVQFSKAITVADTKKDETEKITSKHGQ